MVQRMNVVNDPANKEGGPKTAPLVLVVDNKLD
jgi:hypothetical protein